MEIFFQPRLPESEIQGLSTLPLDTSHSSNTYSVPGTLLHAASSSKKSKGIITRVKKGKNVNIWMDLKAK